MFGLIALVPILGALSAAANIGPEHMKLLPRQIESAFPEACQSRCTGAIKIYNACQSSDYNTCLTVCKQDTFNDFVGCFQCVLDNTPGVTQSEWTQLQSAVDQIKSGCSSGGQAVTGGLQALSGSSSTPTMAGGDSQSASATGDQVFTSAASGVTIVASGASAAATSVSASASRAASATSAAGSAAASATSAASSAAAAASSAAASAAAPSSGAMPVSSSFVGGAVALISVAVGMAIAF